MTRKEAEKLITDHLQSIYDSGESSAIAKRVIENITGTNKSFSAASRQVMLNDKQIENLHKIVNRLLKQEPVQYVLNESWFSSLKFYVDQHVLIPRPETEELIEWIISNCRFPVDELKILDIGSGSGCIPVSLKRRLKKAMVWSCDISPEALAIAKKNATILGTDIIFLQLDFLDPDARNPLPSFDIIVSNPPYVPYTDKETMKPNVLHYEPATALFVPEKDPLLFYKAIAEFGKTHLNKEGSIYCEIHEDMGEETARLFRSYGYYTELKKDMQQKDRMIRSGLVEVM